MARQGSLWLGEGISVPLLGAGKDGRMDPLLASSQPCLKLGSPGPEAAALLLWDGSGAQCQGSYPVQGLWELIEDKPKASQGVRRTTSRCVLLR